MPTTDQLRTRLVGKLKELFQLDQPDLDFGFYRIMHAKAKQVTEFLEKDLLQVIEDTFGNQADQNSAAALTNARRELEEALGADALDENGQLKESFASLPAGKRYLEALAKAAAAKDALSAEGEIYDHLHRFFERYYEDGDFISRRYFNRETAGRAAPFAIPYNGEEVKLHWANADQYYIKTGEYFSNFTIDLAKAPEAPEEMKLESTDSLPVHFRVVDADEGEHGNVKATDATKRFFILHAEDPVGFNDKGELELRFEYRPDAEKSTGQDAKWQEELRSRAVIAVLEQLSNNPRTAIYRKILGAKAPTDANKERTLLAKYLHQYTARNTSDYFIHKDLGSFLRRELDFYIKNEVMRLDDIENEDAPRVESYLAKLKVLRTISRQLIEFLAQLENFQKKLWLKKKFVTETNYGITLDRIPQELYPEIAANDAQREAWIDLYAIDEIEGKDSEDLLQTALPGYSSPLTTEFLKSQPYLVLDTRHFSENFKARLVESIENFDDQCDGIVVQSENFQALQVIGKRFKQNVDSIYIDPPYNTEATPIIYKNEFRHSSWLSFMESRLNLCLDLLPKCGTLCVAIDDFELSNLRSMMDSSSSGMEELGTVAIKNNPAGRTGTIGFSICHEYTLFYGRPEHTVIGRLPHSEKQVERYSEKDEIGRFEWTNFRKHGGQNTFRDKRPRQFYPIYVEGQNIRIPKLEWDPIKRQIIALEDPASGEEVLYPIDNEGRDRIWDFVAETARKEIPHLKVRKDSKGNTAVYRKWRLNDEGMLPLTIWEGSKYSAAAYGTNHLTALFGETHSFSFPKSYYAVIDCLRVAGAVRNEKANVLDFFGGSGTTAEAVIRINREYGGERNYILVEMGDYCSSVTMPRIAKIVYSPDWKNGKPTTRDKGISHCFKYICLESYEDTLNNLHFVENSERKSALVANEQLRRDYTLNYLLEVETRGSQSLLNIDAFTDPTAYTLKVKKPGASGSVEQAVDLIETFNFLLGLRVVHLAAPQRFSAKFKRVPDPDLPKGTDTRLQLDGKMKQSADGAWWLRKVEGWVPKDRENPNNGQKEKILIVWRTLTGNLEEDNLMLDEWFQKNRLSTRDFEFDTIYVNGSNNLPNLKLDSDTWKVRLLEEEFHKAMWDVQDV